MKTKTDQEIFDKTVRHLVRQGKQAMTKDGSCVYLDPPTGCRCAVGCHINKRSWKPEMEGKQVITLLRDAAEWPTVKENLYPHLSLLERLQSVHDSRYNWRVRPKDVSVPAHGGLSNEGIDSLNTIAKEFHLDNSIVPHHKET